MPVFFRIYRIFFEPVSQAESESEAEAEAESESSAGRCSPWVFAECSQRLNIYADLRASSYRGFA